MQTEDGAWGHLGRLVGLAMAADGALLLADDTNGVIYRISYAGDHSTAADQGGPEEPTNVAGAHVAIKPAAGPKPTSQYAPEQLASSVVAAAESPIEVSSPAFAGGAAIPEVYAAEQQNISPPLDWAEGPQGTRSYVVVMEDPDVKQEPPFVHWTLYNLPPDVTDLRELRR